MMDTCPVCDRKGVVTRIMEPPDRPPLNCPTCKTPLVWEWEDFYGRFGLTEP